MESRLYSCPCEDHEGTWVTGGVAPLIFGISTVCRSVVSITVRELKHPGRTSPCYACNSRLGGPHTYRNHKGRETVRNWKFPLIICDMLTWLWFVMFRKVWCREEITELFIFHRIKKHVWSTYCCVQMLLKQFTWIFTLQIQQCLHARSFALERNELWFVIVTLSVTQMSFHFTYNNLTRIVFSVYVVHVLWSDFVINWSKFGTNVFFYRFSNPSSQLIQHFFYSWFT